MRYRFVGEQPVLVPDLHRILQPGEEFESELHFSPGVAELLDPPVDVAAAPAVEET